MAAELRHCSLSEFLIYQHRGIQNYFRSNLLKFFIFHSFQDMAQQTSSNRKCEVYTYQQLSPLLSMTHSDFKRIDLFPQVILFMLFSLCHNKGNLVEQGRQNFTSPHVAGAGHQIRGCTGALLALQRPGTWRALSTAGNQLEPDLKDVALEIQLPEAVKTKPMLIFFSAWGDFLYF